MAISNERQLGRAKNAVLNLLERSLSVPKIYIDADWNGHQVDVLAINRDGVGDVHAVLLFASNGSSDSDAMLEGLRLGIEPLLGQFEGIPAQYKYVGAVDVSGAGENPLPGVPHDVLERSFSPDGMGRVGFLAVRLAEGVEPDARVIFKPERFRAKIAKLADQYVQKHEADWEIRA